MALASIEKLHEISVTIFILSNIHSLECADKLTIPAFAAESCPKNQVEWTKRSVALNCTGSDFYICLPNELFNKLLEFCYIFRITIPKGQCAFLNTRYSVVDEYSCHNFSDGCPPSDFIIDQIFKYPNCVYIGDGCFLAEPSCYRNQISSTNEIFKTGREYAGLWKTVTTIVGHIQRHGYRNESQNGTTIHAGRILIILFGLMISLSLLFAIVREIYTYRR